MEKDMLLAPNGKPSNLTAEKYKLVRTPEFRGWFGFWDIYYNKFALNYYDSGVKETAHKLKKLDAEAIEKASIFLSKQVSSEDVLITMPSRSGCPTDTKNLANAIAKKTNAKIFNCLIGRERESVYNLKKQGADISNFDFDFSVVGKIPKGRKYFIVDNVIGTGASMKNAMQVIIDNVGQNVFPLVYAIDPNKISKVVDENGEPLVVYHGAKKKFNVFKKIQQKFDNENYVSGMWFFADPIGNSLTKEDREYFYSEGSAKWMAEYWYQNDEGDAIAKVFECFLNVKNPIEADDYNTFLSDFKFGYLEKAINKGEFDGYIIHGSLTDGNVFRDDINVFNSNQIKLADGSNTTFDGSNPDIRFAKGGKIKTALKEVESAKSVKYWMQPEFPAESYDYPQKGKPNSFVKMYEEKYNADTILAYDNKGDIVGLFTISKGGDEKGAFKIVVREDSENKGWGKKLLDEAEKQGIDVIGNIKYNSFSHSGRNLLRSWLTKKMEQGASKYEMGGIFHGTPHKFDKFTTDKMGTGEGGQAFGWGLYFTDVEKIGENYAKAISYSNSIAESIAQYVYGTGYTREQSDALMKMEVEEQIKIINDAYDKKVEKINLKEDGDFKNHLLETQNSLKERLIAEAKQVTPHLYEVTLFKGKTPEQYIWLSWYEPISEKILSKVLSAMKDEGRATNTEIERMKINANAKGVDLYNFCVNVYNSPKEASLFLLRAGIDGVKFPAESISKGLTKDNARGYNYVIFNANDVTIDKVTDFRKGGELAMGIKAEMEHKGTINKFKRAGVSNKDVATSIAKDHLKEDPKYYTKLMKIEEKLALGGALLEQKFDVGGNIYFDTPKYKVREIQSDSYGVEYELEVGRDISDETQKVKYISLDRAQYIATELESKYPNGIPISVNIDELLEELADDFDSDKPQIEPIHHGISTNVGDYKNPYEINRAVEKLLNEKGSEQESYTPDEINFISYYSGYGGLDKMGTFSDEEIKGLLYEFYTPDEVVQKMWGLAYKYGYGAIGDNSVFEPSVGIGAFLKYAPEKVFVAANEINKYSAMICEILYPNVQTTLMPFEKNFISKNLSMRKNIEGLKKYSLVIGNPPYGKLGDKAGIYMPMGEDKYSGAANWAEYFLFRGIDLLQKDGLLIYVIGAEQYNGGSLFLDSPLTKTKKAIFEKADLIDAYRLPNKIFERTGVSSEIVIFRKR